MLNEHTRKLLNNIFGSLLSRVVNLGSTLIIVPLALKSLGPYDYGIFSIILSTVIIFSYSDFGLGLAVVNRIASAKCEKSWAIARDAISNVWYFLLRMSVIILILGTLIIVIFITNDLGGGSFYWESWLTLVICTTLGLAPGLTQRILFGLQRNLEANIWHTAGKILSVIGVYIAYITSASMMWFVISMVGIPAIIGWLNTIFLWRGAPHLKPDISQFSWKKLNIYIFTGIQFLFLQLGIFFETGIDNILIGSIQGPQLVTNYDLLARLFMYVPALVSMIAFPLWPAISQAKANGDEKWVRKIFKISFITITSTSIVSSCIFLYFHAEIIKIWVGTNFVPNFQLALALAVFAVLTSIGTLQSVLMSGLGLISAQVRTLFLFLIVLIPSKIFALNFFGQFSMVWALVIAYLMRIIFLWIITKNKF